MKGYELHNEDAFDVLDRDQIAIIMGKRGEGKSALAYRLGELADENWDAPVYVVGFPDDKTELIPDSWHTTQTMEAIPENAFVIVDEAYRLYHARRSQQDSSVDMSKLISLARHNGWNLIFISQESTDIDINIVRETDVLYFKEPSFLQIRFERAKMRDLMEEAKDSYDNLPKSANTNRHVYAMSDEFRGMLTNDLPSFWTEDLSTVFAGAVGLEQEKPGVFAGKETADLIGPQKHLFGDYDDDSIPNIDDRNPFRAGKDDAFYSELSLTEDVLKRVQNVSQRHRELFNELHDEMHFDKGRVKQPISILEKLIRKYLDELDDIIGVTLYEEDHCAIYERVEEIKEEYPIIEEDDHLADPKNEVYYAYHITFEYKPGVEVEMQLKTKEEWELQDEMHDAYKAGEDLEPYEDRAVELARKYACEGKTNLNPREEEPPEPVGSELKQHTPLSQFEPDCKIEPMDWD